MNVRKNAMLLLSLLLCAGRLMATDSVAQSGAEPSKPNLTAGEGRSTVSINGTWQIEESVGANEIPSAFNHSMVVPGMVSLAQPSFTNVGFFASREYLRRFKGNYPFLGPQVLAKDAALPVIGISLQNRNYFWCRTSFKAPQKREVALLKIGNSQFGTKVWLNGNEVGEHQSCWTAGYFNLTDAINWSGENQLLVRIGAHPAVLPETIPGAGTSSSKHYWIPGIYDDVVLYACDNPVIETIQVAPRIGTAEVVIQTKVKNYGTAQEIELKHNIRTWKEGKEVARLSSQHHRLAVGEEKTFTQTVKIPDVRLWSPEDPFLYVLASSSGGDSVDTRFGMREYRFDNKTRMGYLNGKPYYLRGGNIELSLHEEDPQCGNTPWDRAWARKLIAEIPKRLNWNAHRITNGRVPQFWLDIADEEGILIQYEPTLWGYHSEWKFDSMVEEFSGWMRDNWNHPCIFMWDSSNETSSRPEELPKVVNAVRPLDLSGRAWENSWSAPAGLNDPCEAHPYLTIAPTKIKDWRWLNTFVPDDKWGKGWWRSGGGAGRCTLINEYCWLWTYPDGQPIDLAARIYTQATPSGTGEDHLEFRWYMTAALTEMWRAQRCAVGVFYYEYLGSYLRRKAGPYHFGVFSDVKTLQLQTQFEKYMTEAFKPLGVYLKFWGDGAPEATERLGAWVPIRGGAEHPFTIMMVNDDPEPVTGKLVLSLENTAGQTLAWNEKSFQVSGVGTNSYELSLPIPKENDRYLLKTVAYPEGGRHKSPTVALRKVSVEHIKVDAPIPDGATRVVREVKLTPEVKVSDNGTPQVFDNQGLPQGQD